LCSRRRRRCRMYGTRRNCRRGRGSGRRRMANMRCWNRKCRPHGRCWNDDSGRRNRGRSGRRMHCRYCWYRCSLWTGRRSSYAHRCLLLANRIQNVTRPGNIGEIDLGLDLIAINAAGARVLGRSLGFAGSTQVSADLLRLMLFHGTGVRLLLSDAYFRKCVENRFALNFQLPGQIVNSNLGHPPFLSSGLFR
jgi:hypothetical protein